MPPPWNSCKSRPATNSTLATRHSYDIDAYWFRTKKFGDDAPETADLYFTYGKALLENAIAQSSVLGKEQPEEDREGENNGQSSFEMGMHVALNLRLFQPLVLG
jgi:hypothetical protein